MQKNIFDLATAKKNSLPKKKKSPKKKKNAPGMCCHMKKPASARQASSNPARSGVQPQFKRARGKQPDPEKKADDETKEEGEGQEEEGVNEVDRVTLRNRRTSAAYHTTRDKHKPKVSKGDIKGTAEWNKKWELASEKARQAARDAGAKFDKEWSDMTAVQEGILQAGTEEKNENGIQKNGEEQEDDNEKDVD